MYVLTDIAVVDQRAKHRLSQQAYIESMMGDGSRQNMLTKKRIAASARLFSMDEDSRQNMLATKRTAEVSRLSDMDYNSRQGVFARK